MLGTRGMNIFSTVRLFMQGLEVYRSTIAIARTQVMMSENLDVLIFKCTYIRHYLKVKILLVSMFLCVCSFTWFNAKRALYYINIYIWIALFCDVILSLFGLNS